MAVVMIGVDPHKASHTAVVISPAEESLSIWSALYLGRGLSASVLFGGVSLAAFALSMTAGRAFAARVLFGFGCRTTIAVSGPGTVSLGVVLALSSSRYVAGAALLVLGFFLAAAVPAGYGMIDGTPERRDAGVAWATAASYLALMLGPPIMGWLADTVGLHTTMLLLALMAAPMTAAALPARPGASTN
jgi:MFS family permease